MSGLAACATERGCAPAAQAPGELSQFHAALRALEREERRAPVTILHLGDSHIALDHLTGVLRARWQAGYGDAGRGLQPGIPYRYYAPQGYGVSMEGPWEVASSLRADARGPFGIQGFRATASQSGASIEIRAAHDIGAIEIEAASAPEAGSLLVEAGEAAAQRFSTRGVRGELARLRVSVAKTRRVRLSVAGDGPVSLLGIAVLSGHPGVRYDSYGITGATVDVIGHWDARIVEGQLAALRPDLIILGYGTNEGFNGALDLDAYARRLAAAIARFRRMAPQASIAVLGPFDGARRVKAGEADNCGDGWATPAKLDALRERQRRVAQEAGAWFFDGSRVMGGACGIHDWAKAAPPLAWPDHVHLKPEGAHRAGEALLAALMQPFEKAGCAGR